MGLIFITINTHNSLILLEREAGRETEKSLIIFQPPSGTQDQNQQRKSGRVKGTEETSPEN